MSKIKNSTEIPEIVSNLRKQGKKIVTTNGCFDILHVAHSRILQKAKKEGDVLIVLVNNDESVKKLKGEFRPINNEEERAELVSSLEAVDYVVLFKEDDPLDILTKVMPDTHIKGGSFVGDKILEERRLVEGWGGKFKTFPYEEGFSTTNIINKIKYE